LIIFRLLEPLRNYVSLSLVFRMLIVRSIWPLFSNVERKHFSNFEITTVHLALIFWSSLRIITRIQPLGTYLNDISFNRLTNSWLVPRFSCNFQKIQKTVEHWTGNLGAHPPCLEYFGLIPKWCSNLVRNSDTGPVRSGTDLDTGPVRSGTDSDTWACMVRD